MEYLGLCASDRRAWHCPRCGTLRMASDRPDAGMTTIDTAPLLVERCRKFQKDLVNVCDDDSLLMHWRRYGIEESTLLPKDCDQ
jgi:hypothetical protein